jgi:FixJ family two-component response regulator
MDRVSAAQNMTTVFVIDDDPATRDSIAWLLESARWSVETFESGEAFLAAYNPQRPGCLILDIRLPGMSGVALQEELTRRGIVLPVIMLTGFGDVSLAVQAFQQGAFDFIEKPFTDDQILACIGRAIALDRDRRRREGQRTAASSRLNRLTPREREVMAMVVAGKANKVVAYDLGISQKTVESHRARLMEKLDVQCLADLVRLEFVALHGSPEARL